jgi:hypothetical protein
MRVRDPGGRPRKPALTEEECKVAIARVDARGTSSLTSGYRAAAAAVNAGRPPEAHVSWPWIKDALATRLAVVMPA